MSNRTILSFLFFGILFPCCLSAQPKYLELEGSELVDQTLFLRLDGKSLEFSKVNSSVLRKDAFSWHGQRSGESLSTLSFVAMEGHYHGTLLWDGRTYKFKGPGPSFVLSLAPRALPCGGCRVGSSLPPDPRRAGQVARTWRTGDANLIDLLVVYPAVVVSAAGGESALSAAILGAVADANLCYLNSGLDLRLRLVHQAQTTYLPSGVLDTDLKRIKETADGHMDEVHGLRDLYGADLVALLTTTSDTGGLANTMSTPSLNFEDSGFSVSVWDQIGAPSYTLAHEVGHNMGCLHNREDDDTTDGDENYDLFAFSFGKRWQDENSGYRTIMAYDDNAENFPTKIPYFSNPQVSYLGVTTGNAGTENNAKVLSITAPYVSNFRKSTVQAINSSVFTLRVAEGNASSLGVRLAMEPADSTQVTFSISGDSDFQIIGPSILTFDANNWNLSQPVAVFAGSDTDDQNGTATLSLSASGMTTATVDLVEEDQNSSMGSSHFAFAGVVTNELGIGLGGVEVAFSDGSSSVFTDADGLFLGSLSSGWTGSASLSKAGYAFSGASVDLPGLSGHSLTHAFSSSRSTILYVDHDASGQNDGSSWANAFTNLAQALKAEADFQEVWVAEGTYLPGEVRTDTFILPPNIPVYGGFAGNELLRSQRDSSAYTTILSGDLGVSGDHTDNAYHVVSPASGSTLDGFVVQEGYASKNITGDDRGKGGALWADGIAFTVSNCSFQSNRSFQGGSGVYLNDSNASFLNCVFSNNLTDSTGSGAAAYLEDSNVSFESCSFAQNQAHFYGGAIRSDSSALDLLNCTFTSNQSVTSNGGGALYLNGGSFTIRSSVFTTNSANYDGGAVLSDGASGSFADSNFSGNLNTESNGGGALHLKDTNASLSGCRFQENLTYAPNYGGAIKFSNSQSSVSSCVFVSNRSMNNSAGAVYGDGSSILTVSDSNFTSNQATQGGALFIDSGGACAMTGNRFVENSANVGGALYLSNFATSKITGNDFHENNSTQFGGALFLTDGSLEIEGGTFYRNSSTYGGAVAVQYSSMIAFDGVRGLGNEANGTSSASGGFLYLGVESLGADLINCALSGNRAKGYGGVVRPSGNLTITNCTIVGNVSESWGGVVILFEGDVLTLENSILWQNQATVAGNDVAVNTGSASAHYSLFDPSQSYGSISGTSNLSDSPVFVDSDGSDGIMGTLDDDLQFQAGSPGINQGSTSFTNYSTTDLLKQSRSGLPDMGAYEYWSDSPPQFTSSSTVSAAENQTSAVSVSATDAEGSPLSFEISGGSDQTLFSIDSQNGSVLFLSAPDFESPADSNADNLYELEVSVSDGTHSTQQSISLTVTDVAESPQIDGGGSVLSLSMAEDGTVSYDFNATDPDLGTSLTWTLSASPSNGSASIDASAGTLTYSPTSHYAGQDSLTVSVGDGTFTVSREVNLTVTAVNDDPVFSSGSTYSVNEGNSTVTTLSASDPDGDALTFSLSGGVDQSLFALESSSGALTFLIGPSFSNPTDHDADNQYHLMVTVSDASSSFTQGIVISVLEVEAPPENLAPDILDGNASLSLNLSEDGSLSIDLNATDAEGDTLSWTLQSGPSHGSATIDAASGLVAYSPQTDYFGDDNLTVAVSDGNLSDSILLSLSIVAVNDPPVIHSSASWEISENTISVFELNATDADGDSLAFSFTGGTDRAKFDVDSSDGTVTFVSAPDFENPLDGNVDNQYEATISVSDGQSSSTLSFSVRILDQAEDSNESAVTGVVELASDLGSGWRQSSWFGSFYSVSHPWLYHVNLGWIYLSESGVNLWLYQETLGWLWTDSSLYPHLYRFVGDSGNWIYLDPTSFRGRIYDYDTQSWSELR
ncbi:MAG: Ig-like domain-containing protein [Verrucomicrobiota bacterium]|nr:Ig-like domain-containing protein [Verrucomicrobiota bacterium]